MGWVEVGFKFHGTFFLKLMVHFIAFGLMTCLEWSIVYLCPWAPPNFDGRLDWRQW